MSLKNGDLAGTVLPDVSIDEFEPKAGDEKDVIVVAFYLDDQNPADDLNTFIQRGFIDTLDVEVSPNTDEEGRYLVFVEMSRDDTFPNKFQALLKDVGNLTGNMDWQVKTYLTDDKVYKFNDPDLYNSIILNPEEYISKDEHMKESKEREVKEFLEDSMLVYLNIDGNNVIMGTGNQKIMAEMVDVGDYDTVIGRNFLAESAFDLNRKTSEARALEYILGNVDVLPIGKFLSVNRGDKIMLLKNTEILYRG
jgi:hypothetical protein